MYKILTYILGIILVGITGWLMFQHFFQKTNHNQDISLNNPVSQDQQYTDLVVAYDKENDLPLGFIPYFPSQNQ